MKERAPAAHRSLSRFHSRSPFSLAALQRVRARALAPAPAKPDAGPAVLPPVAPEAGMIRPVRQVRPATAPHVGEAPLVEAAGMTQMTLRLRPPVRIQCPRTGEARMKIIPTWPVAFGMSLTICDSSANALRT